MSEVEIQRRPALAREATVFTRQYVFQLLHVTHIRRSTQGVTVSLSKSCSTSPALRARHLLILGGLAGPQVVRLQMVCTAAHSSSVSLHRLFRRFD